MKAMDLALIGSIVFIAGSACDRTPSKPARPKNDAGQTIMRAECRDATSNCYNGCFKRDETRYCPSCCFDQMILCDDEQPYSFEKCDTAETTPKR